MSIFLVDIEADGPCPGMYSMVQLGSVVLSPSLDKTFVEDIKASTDLWVPGALEAIGMTREQTLAFRDPADVMKEFVEWVEGSTVDKPVFMSDNNGFDWQFVNYYCHYYVGRNPFGFSSRRISDLYAGLERDFRGGTRWKRLRKTKHSHNALDDAMGNAEAMIEIARIHKIKLPGL